MKFNSRRQLAQVALFSLLTLGAGSAFAQAERGAPGLPSPSGQAGIKMEATGEQTSDALNAKLGTRTCDGRYQTGNTWNSSGIIIWEGGLGSVTTGTGENTAEKKCTRKMQDKALLENMPSLASQSCAKSVPNGSKVHAISKAGPVPSGGTDQLMGTLVNTPAVTQKKCPAGWLGNNNVDGGVTTDTATGCKKLSGTMIIQPFPANGTPIGTYGFTWVNEVWAYGTPANGGAPITTITSPAVCKWQ